jgi:hypothetical protein
MAILEVAHVVGMSWFFQACMVHFERSLRLLKPMLCDGFDVHPITKHIFHRYRRRRSNVK